MKHIEQIMVSTFRVPALAAAVCEAEIRACCR